MTITKWNRPVRSFPTFMDEFFSTDPFANAGGRSLASTAPAVNVKETDKAFILEVAAPGMKKEDINVVVEPNNTLVISSETKDSKEEKEEGKYTRKEFTYSAFKRSFALPDNVNAENVNAKYDDGILLLTIPKLEEAQQSLSRTIEVK